MNISRRHIESTGKPSVRILGNTTMVWCGALLVALFARQALPAAEKLDAEKSISIPRPTPESLSGRKLELPAKPANYADPTWPAYFIEAGVPFFDATPSDNPTTDAGATLGRVLFYDVALSINGQVSCASCHRQEHAFSDPRTLSVGFDGQKTDRNSMALTDLRFVRSAFFWDERADSLESAVMQPLLSHVEMGHREDSLAAAVQADDRYRPLFQAAFGSDEITNERIAKSLAQFLRALTSTRSRYDEGAGSAPTARTDFANFTEPENLGKRLFFEKCQACHHLGNQEKVALFSMFRSLNNGIDRDAEARDGGRGDATFNPSDIGLFHAQSLRNIEFTAPYMHDGRLPNLEDVIEHYSEGIRRHPTVGPVQRFQFSDVEKTALVAFLKTLGDHELLRDPRFSNPWKAIASPSAAVQSPAAQLQTVTAASPETIASPAPMRDLLDQGTGLTPEQTWKWLVALDRDGDRQFSLDELDPVVHVLARTGRTQGVRGVDDEAIPRAERSRRTGRDPATRDALIPAVATEDLPSTADFNSDGRIDDEETRLFRSLERIIGMKDGGRLEVFLDRLMNGFSLTPEGIMMARASLRTAKAHLEKEWIELDREALARLDDVLGSELADKYRKLIINGQVAVDPPNANGSDSLQEAALRRVLSFDRDQDRGLDIEELDDLCRSISSDPGGFGQATPRGIDVRRFVDRLMKFDTDGNGRVEVSELPERMQGFARAADLDRDGRLSLDESRSRFETVAFERLMSSGIYVGGAFANTLQQTAYRLPELNLPPETSAKVRRILDEHRTAIWRTTALVVTEQCAVIRDLRSQKLGQTAAP